MYRCSKKRLKRVIGLNFNKIKSIYSDIGLNFRYKKLAIKSRHQLKLNLNIKRFSYDKTLKIKIKRVIDFYKSIKNYRGIRHIKKYPVRGQRTRTNAKTRKRLSHVQKQFMAPTPIKNKSLKKK
jgi:small subunit ribosomal protein S13